MSQKIIDIPGLGPVILAKRRGAKNLRLSILPTGKIRISLPMWAPYSAGINFAISRIDWVKQNIQESQPTMIEDGHRIGKSHRINFVQSPSIRPPQARLGINSITITSHLGFMHSEVQEKARQAAERALKKEAEILLEPRLQQIAAQAGLEYKKLKIKRLTSRWGSCSNDKLITLNYFLIQLPWRLIDYVIAHELAHTVHLNHSRQFWMLVEKICPGAKAYRKEIKIFRPILLPDR